MCFSQTPPLVSHHVSNDHSWRPTLRHRTVNQNSAPGLSCGLDEPECGIEHQMDVLPRRIHYVALVVLDALLTKGAVSSTHVDDMRNAMTRDPIPLRRIEFRPKIQKLKDLRHPSSCCFLSLLSTCACLTQTYTKHSYKPAKSSSCLSRIQYCWSNCEFLLNQDRGISPIQRPTSQQDLSLYQSLIISFFDLLSRSYAKLPLVAVDFVVFLPLFGLLLFSLVCQTIPVRTFSV